MAKHHDSLGKFYAYLLSTIDYSKDKAFERYLLSDIAPDLSAGTPPAPWKLLETLQERGDSSGVLAQDRIEADVDEFVVPFSESPESIARAPNLRRRLAIPRHQPRLPAAPHLPVRFRAPQEGRASVARGHRLHRIPVHVEPGELPRRRADDHALGVDNLSPLLQAQP